MNPTRTPFLLAAFCGLAMASSGHGQSCSGDLDDNGQVDGVDLAILLAEWGPCAKSCSGDINNDGQVDGVDIAEVLAGWGYCPLTWATVLEHDPDPAVVFNPALRQAIIATGRPWRVRDNASQIEMLLVPPGTFDMGCIQGSNNYGCRDWEMPVHTVTLTNAFYIGRYEVTQAQWTAVMGSNPSYFQGPYGSPDSPSRPVERVSFNNVQGFLLLTDLRLPTEAQWEFACRGGTTTPFHGSLAFPNGSTSDMTLDHIAWFECHDGCNTHAVGGKAANALGLHDMLGNVSEWCADWHSNYSSSAQLDPTGPPTGSQKMHRGGSWNNGYGQTLVRSSNRFWFALDVAVWDLGFRVARNP